MTTPLPPFRDPTSTRSYGRRSCGIRQTGDLIRDHKAAACANDGSWLYGYISQIGAGAGGFGWLLDEKVVRTGTFCG
ncbi:hypothetical protein [Frankia sp. CiP3]|nr:hypothetical protein [Frankia sp. CiP3]